MAKNMLSVIVRSVVAIALGVLLVIERDAVVPFIVQLLGVALIVPGVVSLFTQFFGASKGVKLCWISCVTSVGSVAMGLWLLLTPAFFVALLMNILGIILLLVGVFQIVTLLSVAKGVRMSTYCYILPVLLAMTGLIVLFNPFGAASLPFLLIGIGAILGGLSDLINSVLIARKTKRNSDKEDVIVAIEDGSGDAP